MRFPYVRLRRVLLNIYDWRKSGGKSSTQPAMLESFLQISQKHLMIISQAATGGFL